MSYKQIHETFWTDPEVKRYKPLHRYLYSYFITSPHAHYSGLYYLPLVYIQNETGLTAKEVNEGITFLSDKGHISYDEPREVMFVKREMIYQLDNKRDGRVILNEKHISGLKKHFDTLHRSPLIAKFLETYPYLDIEYTGIDTPIPDRDSFPFTVPVTVPVKEKKPEKTKYLDSVLLSDEEHSKLVNVMGEKNLAVGIEKLDYSLTVKRGKYFNHYKTLLNWYKRGYFGEPYVPEQERRKKKSYYQNREGKWVNHNDPSDVLDELPSENNSTPVTGLIKQLAGAL